MILLLSPSFAETQIIDRKISSEEAEARIAEIYGVQNWPGPASLQQTSDEPAGAENGLNTTSTMGTGDRAFPTKEQP